MSITNTNAVAKVAAVVAGLGLVAMSFASFAPVKAATTAEMNAQLQALLAQVASLQAQLGTSQSASVTFTRDLTIGSTGADVTALQNWLIGKGFGIAAGATGYFGSQTQAALAAWQAANGVTPAAGYFGPITRAKVNAMAGTTGGTTGGSTAGLSGGEADLTDFNFVSEEGSFGQGEEDVKVATAEFDVDGGDVSVQRVDLEFQAVSTSDDVKPWKYVDSVTVWAGSKKLATVDAGSQDDWDDANDDADHSASTAKIYTITLTGLNYMVDEGDTAELTFTVDAQSTIDSDDETQSFRLTIDDEGIRAVDSAGIQQYTGDVSDYVTVDIDSPEDGNLTIKKNVDTPVAGTLVADETDTSDDFTVFMFDIKNSDDADTKITDLTFDVATGSAAASTGATDITDLIRRATLSFGGDEYDGDINTDGTIDFTDMDAIVGGDDTETGTVTVVLYGQSGHFAATGESVLFSLTSTNVTAEGADSGDTVASGDKSGTATGYTQSIVVDGGITVEGNSMTAAQTYNSTDPQSSYGTFTLKFDVTAIGDDVYIPSVGAGTSAGTNGSTFGSLASTTYAGAIVKLTSALASTTNTVVTTSLSTTADTSGSYFYVVHEGDTETFTVTVVINPPGLDETLTNIEVGLDSVKFSSTDSNLNSLQTLNIDETDAEFSTDPLTIAG